jgi:hypothetical protein
VGHEALLLKFTLACSQKQQPPVLLFSTYVLFDLTRGAFLPWSVWLVVLHARMMLTAFCAWHSPPVTTHISACSKSSGQ